MLRLSMLLSCIFMTNTALDENNHLASNHLIEKREISTDFEKYSVTCYICVNVSDNLICNQFAIDSPCKAGETFCHTLHIMDSKGTSVLVNKKCTTEKECQRSKVGCLEIDSQKICVSCCDQNYCNIEVPTNSTNAIFDDKITKMRNHAKNLFLEQGKALTTTIKDTNQATNNNKFTSTQKFLYALLSLSLVYY